MTTFHISSYMFAEAIFLRAVVNQLLMERIIA